MKAHRIKLKRLNRKGGIEGLPMELMIIVVVAALGTAILVGWMGSIEQPETIGDVESSQEQIIMNNHDSTTFSTTITVRDGNGDPISGATVVLTGCGVTNTSSMQKGTVYGTTNDSGEAKFSGLKVTKTTPGVGYVNVSVSAGDHGEDNSLRIPVVR